MQIPFERYRAELIREGLLERSPYSFYYPDNSMVFTPEAGPDGMIDLDFTTEQIGLWSPELAERIKARILDQSSSD
ncbi:MAG: hypothetical protein BZY87_05510 [SAR202 cluster bacterium Io17-Chloro-G6]|nr:MAG: hypothetical protein BZY87_05510 [SAR202 cluster bacterium Io17-Chloro-G6]